jgi:hypothetical protein
MIRKAETIAMTVLLVVARETSACKHSIQLPPSGISVGFRRRHWFEHTSCFHRGANV